MKKLSKYSAMMVGFALLILISGISAQEYYYHENQRVYLSPNKAKYSVKFNGSMDLNGVEGFLNNLGFPAKVQNTFVGFYSIEIPDSLLGKTNGLKNLSSIRYIRNYYELNDDEYFLINQIIVQFKSTAPESEINDLIKRYNLAVLKKDDIAHNNYLLELPYDKLSDEFTIANQLHSNPLVEYAQPNFAGGIKPNTNDTYYNNQFQLSIIDAGGAWSTTEGLSNIVIAILDNGVDLNHEDLNDKLVTGYDVTDQGDGSPQPRGGSYNYHGTACAGIAAAETNNSQGIAGLARNWDNI